MSIYNSSGGSVAGGVDHPANARRVFNVDAAPLPGISGDAIMKSLFVLFAFAWAFPALAVDLDTCAKHIDRQDLYGVAYIVAAEPAGDHTIVTVEGVVDGRVERVTYRCMRAGVQRMIGEATDGH